jgi:uncharacterized damage-inducible protein DinB
MKEHIELIWNYNYWANGRILARAATLSPAQLAEHAPYMWDSIIRTMAHVLGAEWIWRQRVQEGISPAAILSQDQFPTLELLQERWTEEEALMRDFLAGLRDAELGRVVEYQNTAGQPFHRPLWQLLTHVVNHGTQHRSEVALSLTNFERSPGDMDISVYLSEHGL